MFYPPPRRAIFPLPAMPTATTPSEGGGYSGYTLSLNGTARSPSLSAEIIVPLTQPDTDSALP